MHKPGAMRMQIHQLCVVEFLWLYGVVQVVGHSRRYSAGRITKREIQSAAYRKPATGIRENGIWSWASKNSPAVLRSSVMLVAASWLKRRL